MQSQPHNLSKAAMQDELDLFRAIADYAPAILWITNPEGLCTYLNGAWFRFTGQAEENALGHGWLEVTHPDDRDECERIAREGKAEVVAFKLEYRMRTANGGYRWVLDTANPRYGIDGQFLGFVGSVVDIHDLKLAEERHQLLIDELHHRVKNTLATVQALARQSARPGLAPTEAWKAFDARLLSLASAHDLLTSNSWEGAKLPDVVDQALLHLGRQQVDVRGPEVWLTPQQALSLSMALHELTTNAVKYGALSTSAGRVTIQWRRAGAEVHFSWRERGGPRVAEPTQRGFGSRLLEQSLASDLQGEVTLNFAPDGLSCDITFPLDRSGPPLASASSAARPATG
jgi:PAS domain S-box-containing protein